jgi:PAS domain S-box-containing protein
MGSMPGGETSEFEYRRLVEHSPVGIFRTSFEGRVVAANPSFLRALGFESIEAVNRVGLSAIYVDIANRRRLIERVKAGPVTGFETELRRADGAIISVSLSAYLARDEQGAPQCLEGTLEDVTARRRAEAELRASEEKYRSLLDDASDPIFSFYPGGRYRFVNRAFADGVGKPADEIIGATLWDVFPKEEADHRYAALKDVFDTGLEKVIDVRVPDPTGDRFYVTRIKPVFGADGQVCSAMCSSSEITQSQRAKRAATEAKQRLADIIDFLPIATMVLDGERRVTAWNHAMEEITGTPASELLGKGDHEYSIPFYGVRRPILIDLVSTPEDELKGKYSHVEKQGGILSAEAYIPKIGENGIILIGFATELKDSQGNTVGAIECLRDVTELRRTEAALETARDAAEAANKAKSAFLASMSHELRTPLNAVIGYSEMLLEEAQEAESGELQGFAKDLDRIRGSGKHLLSLISDILDFSKIEAGKMDLFLERFDVSAMLAEVAQTVSPLVEKNGNRLIVVAPGALGEMSSDLTRVKQVLFNLLSNAAKFTDHGTITLEAARGPADEGAPGEAWMTFVISDTGIGMSPEFLASAFQSFHQADASTSKKYGGTGLGLAICRRIALLLKGDVRLESEVGRGTRCTVRIPAEG